MASSALDNLRDHAPLILPSLLLCDFGNLQDEVVRLREAGVKALHLDVMDGRFVPNLTYGMPIVEALDQLTDMPLDVHLMIEEPGQYVEQFREAGADVITIHAEAVAEPREQLQRIRDLGAAAGLAINPQTPISTVENCLDACDLMLVMSVPAGFGGQSFDPVALTKLKALRESKPDMVLEVDGGINTETIGACAEAGAEWFVVGSGIFRKPNYADAVAELLAAASSSDGAV